MTDLIETRAATGGFPSPPEDNVLGHSADLAVAGMPLVSLVNLDKFIGRAVTSYADYLKSYLQISRIEENTKSGLENTGRLRIRLSDLEKKEVYPIFIYQKAERPLRSTAGKFLGKEGHHYSYDQGTFLSQAISVGISTRKNNSLLAGLSVSRTVSQTGEVSKGALFFWDSEPIKRAFGIERREEIQLDILPSRLLIVTDDGKIIREITPDELLGLGIAMELTDSPEAVHLSVRQSFKDREQIFDFSLAKRLKKGYEDALFSPNRLWITDSSITVTSSPIT